MAEVCELSEVSFVCPSCREKFRAAPGRTVESPEEDHPWRYFADCPACGSEANQAHWERNLLRAWSSATGPRTAEGKARVTENLAGHPTLEEARRTRFNAMKHGLFARTATFYPAKPGSYPQCNGCEHLPTEACLESGACLKRSELFLKFHVAFERRDPRLLMELWADNHAALQALISDMIISIARDGGPQLVAPEWYYDKDGGLHFVEYTDSKTGESRQLFKHEAHPLLKPLIDFMHKAGVSMPDLAMTPRAQDEEQILRGFLAEERGNAEAETDFRQRTIANQNRLIELLGKSYKQLPAPASSTPEPGA